MSRRSTQGVCSAQDPSARLPPRARYRQLLRHLGPEQALIALIRLAQHGDSDAEGFIMQHHERHVQGECRRILGPRVDGFDDYVQEGKIALRTPIHRYDPARRVPLWGYARMFVRGRVIDLLGASLGLTRHQVTLYRRLRHVVDTLLANPIRSGRRVEPEEAVTAFRVRYGFGMHVETAHAILEASERRMVQLTERLENEWVWSPHAVTHDSPCD